MMRIIMMIINDEEDDIELSNLISFLYLKSNLNKTNYAVFVFGFFLSLCYKIIIVVE